MWWKRCLRSAIHYKLIYWQTRTCTYTHAAQCLSGSICPMSTQVDPPSYWWTLVKHLSNVKGHSATNSTFAMVRSQGWHCRHTVECIRCASVHSSVPLTLCRYVCSHLWQTTTASDSSEESLKTSAISGKHLIPPLHIRTISHEPDCKCYMYLCTDKLYCLPCCCGPLGHDHTRCVLLPGMCTCGPYHIKREYHGLWGSLLHRL